MSNFYKKLRLFEAKIQKSLKIGEIVAESTTAAKNRQKSSFGNFRPEIIFREFPPSVSPGGGADGLPRFALFGVSVTPTFNPPVLPGPYKARATS
jgi:hypothetical protein